ncbi:hypothetical protein EXT45_30940, partial [Klebsiella pneumoniae]
SAQNREILISESAWEEMTCLFAPSLAYLFKVDGPGIGSPNSCSAHTDRRTNRDIFPPNNGPIQGHLLNL